MDKKSYVNKLCEWLDSLVYALCALIILFIFFAKFYLVQGDSMFPTLEERDRILIVNYFRDPQPGDIVVLEESHAVRASIVKRVVAVEGQIVEIDSQTGVLRVDGEETEFLPTDSLANLRGNQTYPLIVPDNSVFVLGDNRGESYDSRYTEIGCQSVESIIGRAVGTVYPKWGKIE